MVFGKLIYLVNAVFFNSNNINTRPILKIDREMWADKHQSMVKLNNQHHQQVFHNIDHLLPHRH